MNHAVPTPTPVTRVGAPGTDATVSRRTSPVATDRGLPWTWELIAISDEVTEVVVTHDVTNAPATATMIHGDGEADGNGGGGWDQILSALKTLLETGEALRIG